MSVHPVPCDSCGTKSSYDVSSASVRNHLCEECIPFFGSCSPHGPTDIDRQYLGDAKKRKCRHPACISSDRTLTVVRCERKRCSACNFHRRCFEQLRKTPNSPAKKAVIIESNMKRGRKIKMVFCDSHAEKADRSKAEKVIAERIVTNAAASKQKAEEVKTAGAKPKKKPQKQELVPERKVDPAAKAAARESRAVLQKNRQRQLEQLLKGTDLNLAKGHLELLQTLLRDEADTLEDVCANLDHYSKQMDRIISQLSPSSRCSVVGPTGTGKSFFINCLLACTAMPFEDYSTNPQRRKLPDKSIDLEAFRDGISSKDPKPQIFSPTPNQKAPTRDLCQEGMKVVSTKGKVPPGTPGWLLTSASDGDVTTRANVTIAHGETFHFKVRFHTAEEAKKLAFQHIELEGDPHASRVVRQYAKSCWNAFTDTSKTPKNADSYQDIVLKANLPKLGTIEVFAGLGKDANVDRQFVHDQLKALNSRQNAVEQLLIKSVTLYAPCAVLTHTRITDVMGSNDTNPVRTARTREAINKAHALLVVLDKGLTAQENAVQMLKESVFLEQLLAPDSAKQLRFMIVMEKGLGLSDLNDFTSLKKTTDRKRYFDKCEKETRAMLREMLENVAADDASGVIEPEVQRRIDHAMEHRVSVTAVSPALFWSLRLTGTGTLDVLRQTGLPQALGMFRYLDTSAILGAFEPCTGISHVEGKEVKIEGSVIETLVYDIGSRLKEFNDESAEVEDIRDTAEDWARPDSGEKWDVLKANYEEHFEKLLSQWRNAACKQVRSFAKRLHDDVFKWNKAKAALERPLRNLTETNKRSVLNTKGTSSELHKALFTNINRLSFLDFQDSLKKMFKGFLEKDFQVWFNDMLEAIFDKATVKSKSFESVRARMWNMAKSQANDYQILILFDPQLKDNFDSSNLLASLQKEQLSCLQQSQDVCKKHWMSNKDMESLKKQVTQDLAGVYTSVCEALERMWQKAVKRKVKLFHDLLFDTVDLGRSLYVPHALEAAAESECLLHATLRTCVNDARVIGAGNDRAIDLPIDELKELQSKLDRWRKAAEDIQRKNQELLKNPRPWMESVGERLCGIDSPPSDNTAERGPLPKLGAARPANSDLSAAAAAASGASPHQNKKQKSSQKPVSSSSSSAVEADSDEDMPQATPAKSKTTSSAPATPSAKAPPAPSKQSSDRSKR